MRVAGATPSGAAAVGTATSVVTAILDSPDLLAALSNAIGQAMATDGTVAHLADAIEHIVAAQQRGAPGQRIAATVSSTTGNIQYGANLAKAMVFLNGAATAVPAYIPPHVQRDLVAGSKVWVEPVNGNMADLQVVGIRASGQAWGVGSLHASQPAVPASGTAQTNTYAYPVSVVVGGGTVTQIQVDGVTLPSMTAGTVRVPKGKTIKLTYSVAPTWEWFAD